MKRLDETKLSETTRPETFWVETETRSETHRSETRPRRWALPTSRDRLETETSRPRPHPWFILFFLMFHDCSLLCKPVCWH